MRIKGKKRGVRTNHTIRHNPYKYKENQINFCQTLQKNIIEFAKPNYCEIDKSERKRVPKHLRKTHIPKRKKCEFENLQEQIENKSQLKQKRRNDKKKVNIPKKEEEKNSDTETENCTIEDYSADFYFKRDLKRKIINRNHPSSKTYKNRIEKKIEIENDEKFLKKKHHYIQGNIEHRYTVYDEDVRRHSFPKLENQKKDKYKICDDFYCENKKRFIPCFTKILAKKAKPC